ncbi:MAG: hypothetical protein NC347_08795 [Clostridium sp.]|nr:hypothetical protein [Clostridium sp.]
MKENWEEMKRKKIFISIIIISIMCFIILCSCYLYYKKHLFNTENQICIFAENVDEWIDTYKYSAYPFYVTVTDLNKDGKLELITATIDGTAKYSHNNYYVVKRGKGELIQLQTNIRQGQSSADIIYNIMYEENEKENVPVYYDVRNNMYYSIHKDYIASPEGQVQSIVGLTLNGDMIQEERIVYAYYEHDEKLKASYWNYEGEKLSAENYKVVVGNPYPDLERMEMTWKWRKVTWEEISNMDQNKLKTLLDELYNDFAIEKAKLPD